jgi:MFS family permease
MSPPRKTLWIVFFTIFLDLVGFGIIIPIQPFYAEVFNATPAEVTLLGAAYSLMQFLFAPVWGRLSDRVGRRPVMLISIGTSVVGYILFGLAESLPMLYGARLLAGLGNANIGTAQAIIADSTPPENRAKGMGLIGAAFGLGFIFGPAIGGAFGQVSLATPAFVAAGLAAVNWLSALWFLPETHTRREPAKGRSRFSLGLSVSALREVLHFRNAPQLLWLFFAVTLAFSQMEQVFALFIERTWVPEALEKLTRSAEEIHAAVKHAAALTTKAFLAVGITATFVQGFLIGRLARRFGERRLIAMGTAILAVSLGFIPVMGEIGSFPLFMADCALIALGSGITTPSLSSLLSRSVDESKQGLALGVGQSLAALGRVFGPSAAGVLFEVERGLPFWVGGGLMLTCAAVAFFIHPPLTAAETR